MKFLTKARLDTRYRAFEVFLERPRAIKARNNVTSRIVTKADIENVLAYISTSEGDSRVSRQRAEQYAAFILLGAYTGQRSVSTMATLRVGQFREALQADKPCIEVRSSQDKIKMQHYVPPPHAVISALRPLFDGKRDAKPFFEYNSFQMWVKRAKIPLSCVQTHFVLGDLRKFTEQYGDITQLDQSHRAYIMTHGVSGIDWKHYKHPLPERVCDIYMQYWKDVRLSLFSSLSQ
ncbi:MAG: hypothetical protein ACXV49_09930 [Halobacteriota archaeon]